MPTFDLQPPTPHELYDTAMTFLDIGMPDAAIPYLLTLSRQFPVSPEIQEALAKAHLENQEYPQALNAIQLASRLDPTNHSYYTFMGYAHILCDQLHDASRAFATALELHPQDCDALTGLSDALFHLNRHTEVVQLLERTYPTLPADTSQDQRLYLATTLCRAYFHLERFADICTLPSDPLLPEHPTILLYRGIAAGLEDHLQQSLTFLARADSLTPNSPKILQNLGIAQWRVGRVFQATRTLTAALQALDHTDDSQRTHLSAALATLELRCVDASMRIAAGGSFTDYPALYPPPLDESTTDPDRFAVYVESITNMPGALYRALLEYGHEAIALYDAGIEALDADHHDAALQQFREVFRLIGDDPVICGALITAFDMLTAPEDASVAEARRDGLHDHPRLRAITLYHQAMDAFGTFDMDTIVRRLHDLEPLDVAMAQHIRCRIEALSHPDSTYDQHNE